MKRWIAFWNILVKDMRAYYLKPPNISWGLIFPFAWTAMFFIKSGGSAVIPAVALIAVSSTFMGLFIAVSVSEVFEAQTFSNFFRFPMVFLCGLFFPIDRLPLVLKPLSYVLPLTYGADILHRAFNGKGAMPIPVDFGLLLLFCLLLFAISLRNIRSRWIA